MHHMVIGITMEMNLVAFSKASSPLTICRYKVKTHLILNFYLIPIYILVELVIGKSQASNGPNQKDGFEWFDEVGPVTEP